MKVDQEFKCPHGVVVARRYENGTYAGCAAEDVCTACAVKTMFSIGPHEIFPRRGRKDGGSNGG